VLPADALISYNSFHEGIIDIFRVSFGCSWSIVSIIN